MTFDHDLKLRRALKHLNDLDAYVGTWIGQKHYRVRYEYEPDYRWDGPIPPGKVGVPPDTWRSYLAGSAFMPNQPKEPMTDEFGVGRYMAFVTAEQPPADPVSLLIGDTLHNLRSCLDVLAFALASAYTKPLTKEMANTSEFPIFGDEDGEGHGGMGSIRFHERTKSERPSARSALAKISGWHPDAQAVVEGLQPYKRGKDFRSDPLWLVHDLDRISKHRLLHPALAAFAGTLWDVNKARNIRAWGPGFLDSYGGVLEPDTPIGGIVGVQRIDPNAKVEMPIAPALAVVFGPTASGANGKEILPTLAELYNHLAAKVIPALAPYL